MNEGKFRILMDRNSFGTDFKYIWHLSPSDDPPRNTGPSGVPLFSENRHVRRIYRLAVQSVAKMGIQGGFTGLQGHFYWGLLYKDLQNLASRSVAKNTL